MVAVFNPNNKYIQIPAEILLKVLEANDLSGVSYVRLAPVKYAEFFVVVVYKSFLLPARKHHQYHKHLNEKKSLSS
ncbi:hypothetical protein CEXT_713751 [Caerostris extrusa]|uniref:Uncharacterized protein n=1 Tax=Caerostris extrusa TaxID=172846 RepID=A0AAV4UB36_CAEEX|nr:hypothetical protein CEXT_713751 [Caerostris extrusa]